MLLAEIFYLLVLRLQKGELPVQRLLVVLLPAILLAKHNGTGKYKKQAK